jgi:hypothetical protein
MAQNIYYSLSGSEAETVMLALYEIYCAPREADSRKPAAVVD